MPKRNAVRPLFTLERSEHVLFRVRDERKLRVVFTEAPGQVSPTQIPHSRTLVMFIHGVGGSLDVWQHQMKACLQHGYGVLAVDLLGHGGSSKPHDKDSYLFRHLADDLIDVFDAYKRDTNFLVGHSYGSSFCTFIAVQRDECVQGMVLIAGGSPTPLLPERCSMFSCPLPVLKCMHVPLVSHYRRIAFYTKTKGESAIEEAPIQVSPFVLNAVMHGQVWPESTEEYHSQLSLPVMLLAGLQDNLVSAAEEEWMQETIAGSQLHIINGAGHMVIIEQPDRVNKFLLDFIKECLGISNRESQELNSVTQSQESLQNDAKSSQPPSRTQSQLSKTHSLNSSIHSSKKGKVLF